MKFRLLKFRNLLLLCYLSISAVFVFLITKQTYGVNDDVVIQDILSGTYTGKPEFIFAGPATPKIFFGLIISTLYKVAPYINWFPIIMLSFVLIAWFLIGQIALNKLNIFNLSFYFLLSFIYLFWFIPSPTYTASSIILSIATFSKILIEEKTNLYKIIFYSTLLSFSFLMRPESFLFGIIVILVLSTFTLKKKIKNNLKIYSILPLTFFTVFLINFTLEKRYIDNNYQWLNYSNFEAARYKIQANDIETGVLNNPKRFGWSSSEIKLFQEYLSIDKNRFNASRYNQLIIDYKLTNQENFSLSKFFIEGHKKLINSDLNWAWFDLAKLIPLSFVLFLIMSWPRFIEYLSIYLLSSIVLYLAMIYIAYYLRQPERVQVSAIFAAILIPFLIYNLERIRNENSIDLSQVFMIFMIFTLMILNSARQISYFDQKYNGMDGIWINQSKFYESFPKDSIFIGNASQFRNNWQNPYLNNFQVIEKRFFSLGWHNYSPFWLERAKGLNLDGEDLINSSINQSNVYWVSDESTFFSLIDFLRENKYNFSNYEKVKNIILANNDYIVWKIS